LTERERKPDAAEPTPELPESGADLEPRDQPLAHDEPTEAHTDAPIGSTERAIAGQSQGLGEHGPDTHVDEHATTDPHAHEEVRLGPIDWPAWGYALLGIAVALVVVLAFWVAAYD
jgi:hypothetical protein